MNYYMQKVIKNPANTKAVFDYLQSTYFIKNRSLVQTHLARIVERNPLDSDFEKQYDPDVHMRNIPDGKFATGTLGEAAQKYFNGNQLSVGFYPTIYKKFPNRETYIIQRTYQSHDLFHVLLGVGITPLEEMAVLSFSAGQFGSPTALNVAWMTYFHCLRANPFWGADLIRLMTECFAVGEEAKSVMAFHPEEHLNESLKDVRAKLGLPVDGIKIPFAPTH